jgi:hypothetical protein
MLRKYFFSIAVVIACLVTSLLLANTAIAGEKEKSLLKSIERIKAYTETGTNFDKYSELLADAETEFNIYKRSKKNLLERDLIMKDDPISQFMRAVRACLGSYDLAKVSWDTKNMIETSFYRREGREKANEFKQSMQESWKRAEGELDLAYKLEENIK